MPRQARLDVPDLLQHVIARGIERCEIFRDDKDRENFLERLGDNIEKGEYRCFAWVLIPNHFHLLIRTGATPLSTLMRRLMTGHAVYFNKRHKRSGHLFQNRYKSIICEEDPYLLELVRYIHLNPLRAGLLSTLEDLDYYPWSGHATIMGNRKNGWQAVNEVLLYFSDKREKARKEYRKFIAGGIKQEERPDLEGNSFKRGKEDREGSDERILGSGDFVAKVLKDADELDKKRKGRRLTLPELIKKVANYMGFSEETLISTNRQREISKARAIISFLAVRKMGYTPTELGRILNISRIGAMKCVWRGEKIIDNYKELWNQISY